MSSRLRAGLAAPRSRTWPARPQHLRAPTARPTNAAAGSRRRALAVSSQPAQALGVPTRCLLVKRTARRPTVTSSAARRARLLARSHRAFPRSPRIRRSHAARTMGCANNYGLPSTVPPDNPTRRVDMVDLDEVLSKVKAGAKVSLCRCYKSKKVRPFPTLFSSMALAYLRSANQTKAHAVAASGERFATVAAPDSVLTSRSALQFPYCDGSHVAHNEATGDNMCGSSSAKQLLTAVAPCNWVCSEVERRGPNDGLRHASSASQRLACAAVT